LQADAHVLDGPGEHAVGDAGEGAGQVVLRVAEGGAGEGRVAAVFEVAAGGVEGAELDGDAGADAEERGEGAFVKGEGAFVAVDGGGGGEGGGVGGGGLEADFDNVEGLAWRRGLV
jgi:hypothetical protein